MTNKFLTDNSFVRIRHVRRLTPRILQKEVANLTERMDKLDELTRQDKPISSVYGLMI